MTMKEKQDRFMNNSGIKMKYLWDYYSLDKNVIPVYNRKPFDNLKAKTHTNLHIDFFGDIIGIKRGYIGEQITINYTDDTKRDLFNNMVIESNMNTCNSQTIEYSSVEGVSHRICYTEDGIFKQENVHGWQVFYEGNPYNPELAYYFYKENGKDYCNLYDQFYVYIYELIEKDKTSEYVLIDEKEHNFNRVPVVPFLNNSNSFSNCDASLGIMNEYDNVISDSIGEIKDLRRALLKVKGDIYTDVDSDGNAIPVSTTISRSSVLIFGPDIDGKSSGDADYITSNLNDDAITSTLDRLRGLIYETSGSVDLKELSTAERVFSIKASLLRLENDAKTSENYFIQGIKVVLSLWAFLMSETGNNIDDSLFEINIGRKIPMDELGQAEILLKLSSVLSLEDALKIAGYENYIEMAERAADSLMEPYIPTQVIEE